MPFFYNFEAWIFSHFIKRLFFLVTFSSRVGWISVICLAGEAFQSKAVSFWYPSGLTTTVGAGSCPPASVCITLPGSNRAGGLTVFSSWVLPPNKSLQPKTDRSWFTSTPAASLPGGRTMRYVHWADSQGFLAGLYYSHLNPCLQLCF